MNGDGGDRLAVLYQENARIASVFWEWRHKLLTYAFSGIAGLLIAAAWLHSHEYGRVTAVPFFLAVLVALAVIALNERTGLILSESYRVGADLKKSMRPGHEGIFEFMRKAYTSRELPIRIAGRSTTSSSCSLPSLLRALCGCSS